MAGVNACKAHLAVLGGLGLDVGGLPYAPIHGEDDQRGLQMTCGLWQHGPGLGELQTWQPKPGRWLMGMPARPTSTLSLKALAWSWAACPMLPSMVKMTSVGLTEAATCRISSNSASS